MGSAKYHMRYRELIAEELAEGPRSAAFYERLGFEPDGRGRHQFVLYPEYDLDAYLNEAAGDLNIRVDGNMIVAKLGERDVAWYTIDLKRPGLVSLHAAVDADARRQGISSRVYDWAERFFKPNRKLVPFDRLSPEAYAMWQKRDPETVKNYTRDGENYYLMEKVQLIALSGSAATQLKIYSKPSKGEIKRALAAAEHGTLRGGWSNGLVMWDANHATHSDVSRSLGGLGNSLIMARTTEELLAEADWNCAGTLYQTGVGGILMGIGDFAESLSTYFGGLKRVGQLIWSPFKDENILVMD